MNTGDGNGDSSGNGICFPSDVLVDILGRLPRRALARSCCVCRTWRALVTAHKLIPPLLPLRLPHYFPRRAFGGIFFNKNGFASNTSFFGPPGSERLFFPHEARVRQSCNGLLLLHDCVLNPATGRCSRLPSLKPWRRAAVEALAFDPAVSLHYDVYHLEELAARPNQGEVLQQLEKSLVSLLVYSSRTGRWESRELVPGRCAPGHLYDAVATPKEEEKQDDDGYSWSSYDQEHEDNDAYSWNSDTDNFIDIDGGAELLGPPSWGNYCRIVGFHPHKNALILIIDFAVVVYHLDTSRMQYIGEDSQLMRNPYTHASCVNGSFTYRPCYADVLTGE
ncbi:uncharacterized protein [Lolium perenne]|uniref:uncharacterized protein n=1 Tax=Lolium perenne TaxID=4522 RepID=UPI0021F66D00|nr:uncharacterized protein LOC127340472 [Lolium perenne]